MLEQHLRGTFEPSRNMTRMVLDNWTVQSSKWLWMTWVILQPGTLGMEVIGCRGFCAEPYSWYISNTNISKPFGGGMNVQMGSLTCATLNLEFLFREVPHFVCLRRWFKARLDGLHLRYQKKMCKSSWRKSTFATELQEVEPWVVSCVVQFQAVDSSLLLEVTVSWWPLRSLDKQCPSALETVWLLDILICMGIV